MHYFIDGYNMLFRLMNDAKDHLQAGRELIILDLNKKIALLEIDVTIVFDAPFQFGEGSRTHFDQLEILFTAERETADEFILEEIKESAEPQKEIVVTSDKQLARRVRNQQGQTQSVEEFWEWLNRSYKNKCRHKKKEQKGLSQPVEEMTCPPLPTLKRKIPDHNASLEKCEDYYTQIFTERWKKIAETESKQKTAKKKEQQQRQPPPRRPKRRKDPFAPAESQQPDEATQMERWLKIFEKRIES
jgi:predicted RNA-binding protein with PIN domain